MNRGPQLQTSFTFPYRWLANPEDRKYISENFVNAIKKSGLKAVYGSGDKYAAELSTQFTTAYLARLKTHAYQPAKVNLTQKQLQTYLKPFFGEARCMGFDTFFVQTNNPTALPVMEMELFY